MIQIAFIEQSINLVIDFRKGSVIATFVAYLKTGFYEPKLNETFLEWYRKNNMTADLILDENHLYFDGK